MDELENKELEPGVEENTEASANTADEPDELVKELEEIRDMFQEALDSANAQDADEGEFIQELEYDENPADEEEASSQPERPVCECCGEREASDSYGEDYPFCDECRELMKHYPLRISGVISIFCMIAVFALSVFFGYSGIEKSLVILDAQANYRQGKMLTTLDSLYSYISADKEDSKKASSIIIDSFCRSGYISDAKTYIENIYSDSKISKKHQSIIDKTDAFVATQEATQEIVYDAFRGAEFDYEELAAKLDAVKESFIDEEKGIKYVGALTDYYKAELMELKKISNEEQLGLLQKVMEEDEDGFYLWMYGSSLCEAAAKTGDKELAESYFELLKENNSEDMSAYKAMASYYRFLDTPDADAMIALAEEAEKNARNGDLTYYTILATAYLLKEEGALAYETMQEYMGSSRYTVSDCNLYALCALYSGNSGSYETIKATLESSGFRISPLVEGYKNGEISLKEVLSDMGGDL